MIRLTTLILFICLFAFSCSQEPVVSQESSGEEQEQVEVFNFEQVRDDGKVYSSDDFFNAGFNEYKEYNVSKLTDATEAWYGYWGPDEDSEKYYELRFYPDHATAVSTGTAFAEDDTGEDAKLGRQETMWRVGLADRKVNSSCEYSHGKVGTGSSRCGKKEYKYPEYVIFSNLIMLCGGADVEDAVKNCEALFNTLNNVN